MKLSFVVQVPEEDDKKGREKFGQQLKVLSDLGYNGVVLAIRDPEHIDTSLVENRTGALGLEIPAISTGAGYIKDGLSLSHAKEKIRTQAINKLCSHILLAEWWNSKVIIGLIRGSPKQKTEKKNFISDLGSVGIFSVYRGVELLLEPINRYETSFIHTLEEANAVIEEIRENIWAFGSMVGESRFNPDIRILADTFHMNIEEKSITESLIRHAGMIGHVDVADSNRMAPGQGHLDFPSILRTFKETGYEGYLCVELVPVLPDFETAARQSIEYLGTLLKKI